MMFHDRAEELGRLEARSGSAKAELVVIYGRRRVGKTALINRFLKRKDHIYFACDLSSDAELLRQFSEKIYVKTGEPFLAEDPFPSWQALFAYIGTLSKNKRCYLAIDEFQYLAMSNPALPSILQKVWDEQYQQGQLFLILCGSYVSFMEEKVLGYKSPLYGRRTGQLLLKPMDCFDIDPFFPGWNFDQRLAAYGILGGTPAYLAQFDPKKNLAANVEQACLQVDSYLFEEVRFLLIEEMRDPRNYFSIIKAIAFGCTKANEIVQHTGLDRGMVMKYLDVLRGLRVLEREVPVTDEQPSKSRKGIYLITDHFFRFWFRFVMPNRSYVEEGASKYVLKKKILPFLDQFLGLTFEAVAIEFLRRQDREGSLPLTFQKIGRYWDRQGEIDMIALDEENKELLVAECKWSTRPIGTNILHDLIQKRSRLPKKLDGFRTRYALFSRAGFTAAMKSIKREDLLLFAASDKGLLLCERSEDAGE